jgi:exopolyphosphatase / guanosine-5'-triphosphate,3'-diphosphate pyrophosphatase
MGNIAAIDVGSHTARLLIARETPAPGAWQPVLRKRAYIRLAEDFLEPERGWIKPGAIARALDALGEFAGSLGEWEVRETWAVATGVVRDALNAERFLNLIAERTGIRVRAISGEEEALLTGRGVLHALGAGPGSLVIFDLGGGSTEFVFGRKGDMGLKSLSLGAMLLTRRYLHTDPPEAGEIRRLIEYADAVLKENFHPDVAGLHGGWIAGTGGTVTTLAAMIHGIPMSEIEPEGMNGLGLEREEIKETLKLLRTRTLKERLSLPGLDRGRADVIIAGTLTVLCILNTFGATRMTVSLSDLLEGLLIENAAGC